MTTVDFTTNARGTKDWLEATEHLIIMAYTEVLAPPVAPDDGQQVGRTEDPKVLEWAKLQKEIKEEGTLTLDEVKARYGL